MADFPKVQRIEDARYCLEQAREMLERARSMWAQANEAVQMAQSMRADLSAQIQELARRGVFRRQLTSTLLSRILDAAIEATGADKGNIQLFDPKTGQLRIFVQHGFKEPFLEFFNSVHAGQAACGTALRTAHRVIVPDVTDSTVFSDSDCVETLLDAGVRAVQSTPLIGKSGRIWGMLSTHYRTAKQPGKKDLRLLDYFADWAAEIVEADHLAAHSGEAAFSQSGNGTEITEDASLAKP